jgi:hypothetical protein
MRTLHTYMHTYIPGFFLLFGLRVRGIRHLGLCTARMRCTFLLHSDLMMRCTCSLHRDGCRQPKMHGTNEFTPPRAHAHTHSTRKCEREHVDIQSGIIFLIHLNQCGPSLRCLIHTYMFTYKGMFTYKSA